MSEVGRIHLDTKRLDEIVQKMPARAEEVLDQGAFLIEADAKIEAPKDTGALANSIHVTKPEKLIRRIQDAVLYGIFQELGTSRMRAQPFMVPSLEKNTPKIKDLWKALFA